MVPRPQYWDMYLFPADQTQSNSCFIRQLSQTVLSHQTFKMTRSSRGQSPPRGIGHGAARLAEIFRARYIRAGLSGTDTTVLGEYLFQKDKIQINSWY